MDSCIQSFLLYYRLVLLPPEELVDYVVQMLSRQKTRNKHTFLKDAAAILSGQIKKYLKEPSLNCKLHYHSSLNIRAHSPILVTTTLDKRVSLVIIIWDDVSQISIFGIMSVRSA